MADDVRMRALGDGDQDFVEEMTFQALYQRSGEPAFERSVLEDPGISHYFLDFGDREGDMGILAYRTSSPAVEERIGAAWLRLLTGEDRGYGWVSDETPELTIGVESDWRGRNIGTMLAAELLMRARSRYSRVSLSVDPENYAYSWYLNMGFTVVGERGTSLTLALKFSR